jgi:adenosylcobinamide-phosphate synthase
MMAVSVLLLALALDLAVGDPPSRWHPVAAMGRLIAGGRRRLCHGSPPRLLLAGAALTVGVVGLAAAAGGLVAALAGAAGAVGPLVQAVALKSTLSVRGLAAAARSVAAALAAGDLDQARALVGWHLVSRPTATLSAEQVASAAVESVAENLTDSLVAPACFFLLLGVPGALAYRALNTADTMLGYREGALEHFGKAAARLDDVANFVPARLAALAIVAAAGRRAAAAWSVMRREHARTASPNAGWTMAAMAGALGVALDKPGAYRLGAGALPGPADVERSVRRLGAAGALAIAALAGARIVLEKAPW